MIKRNVLLCMGLMTKREMGIVLTISCFAMYVRKNRVFFYTSVNVLKVYRSLLDAIVNLMLVCRF